MRMVAPVNNGVEIYHHVRMLALLDAEQCALSYALRCANNGWPTGADVAQDIAKEIRKLKEAA